MSISTYTTPNGFPVVNEGGATADIKISNKIAQIEAYLTSLKSNKIGNDDLEAQSVRSDQMYFQGGKEEPSTANLTSVANTSDYFEVFQFSKVFAFDDAHIDIDFLIQYAVSGSRYSSGSDRRLNFLVQRATDAGFTTGVTTLKTNINASTGEFKNLAGSGDVTAYYVKAEDYEIGASKAAGTYYYRIAVQCPTSTSGFSIIRSESNCRYKVFNGVY